MWQTCGFGTMERKMERVRIQGKWERSKKEGNYKIYILYPCVEKQVRKKKKRKKSGQLR
jgi:DNA invertase Pin-like site-specific DNA recombinase